MTLKELLRQVTGRTENAVDTADASELSDAYLEKLQRDVDSKLSKDIKFTSVSRASW